MASMNVRLSDGKNGKISVTKQGGAKNETA